LGHGGACRASRLVTDLHHTNFSVVLHVATPTNKLLSPSHWTRRMRCDEPMLILTVIIDTNFVRD
jgi:hypothetical protein